MVMTRNRKRRIADAAYTRQLEKELVAVYERLNQLDPSFIIERILREQMRLGLKGSQ